MHLGWAVQVYNAAEALPNLINAGLLPAGDPGLRRICCSERRFAAGGVEFPLVWVFMLIAQVLLGDGAYALRVPAPSWERAQPTTA